MQVKIIGIIGLEVSGTEVAHQIDALSNEQKIIEEFINTPGGDVPDMLSIIQANIRSKAEIHTFNMGLAASAGFQIFLSGDVYHAIDYARWMAHDPAMMGSAKSVDDMPDSDPNKEALINLRDQIAEIISNRTGKSVGSIVKILAKEAWFDIEKMRNFFGLDITVISSKKKPNLKKNASISEFVNFISNFNPEIDSEENHDNMADFKKLLNKLSIRESIENPESEITSAIGKLQNKVQILEEKEKAWDKSKLALEKKVTDFEDSQKNVLETEADTFVNELAKNGLIREEGKEGIKKLFLADPETTKTSFGENLIAKVTNIIDPTKPEKETDTGLDKFKDKDGNVVVKDINWMAENEEENLNQWEAEAAKGLNTEGAKKFKAMFKAEFKEDFDKTNIEPSK
jgi:ATP-dependent protease ClpP protease subunit